MLFDVLFSQLEWNDYGIVCHDPKLAKHIHTFMREAILDRHIYLRKVTSFAVSVKKPVGVSDRSRSIGRNSSIGESYPELMLNLSDKIFYQTTTDTAKVSLDVGNNTIQMHPFTNKGETIKTLFSNPNICRVIHGTGTLEVNLTYDCGFRDMSLNTNGIGKEFFPCYTDYSVADYFRVLPEITNGSLVSIRCCNNASMNDLKSLLVQWLVPNNRDNIKKEEREWLQNFELSH